MRQLELHSPAKKWAAVALIILTAGWYVALACVQVLAAYFSASTNPAWMKRAIWLDPDNAAARHRLGVFELFFGRSPESSLPWLKFAAASERYNGQYWIDLALAEHASDHTEGVKESIQRALDAEPRTPQIAWQAANLYLSQGDAENALQQFRAVLQNDSDFNSKAIQTCWKLHPDGDYLAEHVVPPHLYPQFLQFLIAQNETTAAASVWEHMFSLQQSVGKQDVFDYIRYLVLHREAAQAKRTWQQAAAMAGLQAYEPSPENLLVNGDFSLAMLNGGFDWVHQKIPGVSLALDPTESPASSRSLRITFDGPGIYDAGISQVVAVEPSTAYEFSAFYKTADMDGAGGMQLAIQDAYKGTSFFASENLRDADVWKKTSGSFTTGPDTELLLVHVVRVPANSPIRGKLWMDGLQLVESNTVISSVKDPHSAAKEPQ